MQAHTNSLAGQQCTGGCRHGGGPGSVTVAARHCGGPKYWGNPLNQCRSELQVEEDMPTTVEPF